MIDKKTVEYIAQLARLEVTEQEKELFVKELSAVLEYVEFLKGAPTGGIEPTAYATAEHNPLRDDVVQESLPAGKLLQNGPSVKKGFFAVPKVIG
jgi:aspartyl-tRNA(Asn)/glutamyl-tRNA(Gln) amidotransferase subunit C